MIDPLTLYLLRRGKSVINVQRLFPAYKAYPFPSQLLRWPHWQEDRGVHLGRIAEAAVGKAG